MPDLWMDVDAAVTVPCNIVPLVATSDGKTVADNTIAYNETGLEVYWNFVTTAGAITCTPITPTTSGDYDWTHVDGGMYKIEIPASGGASANNATEGFGWITGACPGGTPEILPFRGPTIGFRDAALNNLLIDSAFSATRGLAGTALPAAAADAAGGLVISDAGGLDIDTKLAATNEVTAARMGALTDWIDGGRLDLIIDGILTDTGTTLQGELDGIQADTEDIQSRLPAALVSGRIDSSVGAMAANVLTEAAIADNAIAAEHLAAGAIDAATFAADVWTRLGIVAYGTMQAGSTGTTAILAAATDIADDFLNGSVLVVTGGTGAGQSRLITDWDQSDDTATVDTWTTTPDVTSTYVVFAAAPASATSLPAVNVTQWLGTAAATPTTAGVPEVDVTHAAGTAWGSGAITAASLAADAGTEIGTAVWATTARVLTANTNLNDPTAASIADAVWDEAATGHTDAGKAGEQLWTDVDAILTDTATIDTAGEIAAAVWSADATTYQTQGTFGQAIGDPAADTNSIFKAVVTDATGATVGVDAAAILADTNELQTDWVDGGRLDLLLDAKPILTTVIESQGSVTLQQVLQALLAACAGVTDDSDTSTMLLKTPNGSATRITATLDGTDRTAISLSFS